MEKRCGNCFQLLNSGSICPFCGYDNIGNHASNTLEVGFFLFHRYVIGRVLGIGGFGITYLAYDILLSHRVAIKEYLPNEFSTRVPTQAKVTVYTGDKQEQFLAGQKRFVEEAKKLARFQNQEGIVHIFDCFDENNTSYIVMEYLEGKTLQEVLGERKTFRVSEAAAITVSILDALKEVHREGMLHRDIAPDNVFLTDDGKVKLIDFGAAKYATTTHSKSLSVIIKQGYAPPEQYRSKGEQGTWTDIYGAAATMYKMVTGVTPEDSMERQVRDSLKPPSKLGIKMDKSMENALMNGLNIPIEKRTKTADAFKKELMAQTVKRNTVKMKQEDVGKAPVLLKTAVGVLFAAMAVVTVMIVKGYFNVNVGVLQNYTLEDGKTRVPNLVNSGLEEAQKSIEEQYLKFVIADKQYSSEIPKDKVLIQSIEAGSIVEEGTVIEVTVSGGEKEEDKQEIAESKAGVPDIQYKSEEEAVRLLEEAGLLAEIRYEEDDKVAEGLVIRQETAAGTVMEKGSKVVFYVCKKEKKPQKNSSSNQRQGTAPQQSAPSQQQPQATPEPAAPTPQPPAADDGWQGGFELEW